MDAAPDPVRSLHEVFESLAGDPAADPGAALAASGHGELPADLFTEAVVSYADSAPPEVAEHLAPVVLGAGADPGLGLELLASAPQVTWDDVPDDVAPEPMPEDVGDDALAGDVPDGDVPDLDFGAGEALDALDGADDVPDLDDGVADPDDADALEDGVPPVAAAAPAVDDDVTIPEPDDDDLPHPDLAGEGWDDAAWDGGDDTPDDLDA